LIVSLFFEAIAVSGFMVIRAGALPIFLAGALVPSCYSIYIHTMSRHHDKWYTRIFSDPKIVEELLRSFVHEEFVKELDFSSLKKLNTKFIPVSEKSRHADVVYEIKSHGQSAYIYLFLEFQSTVDRFMALRMGRYIFEFYQEVQRLTKSDLLNPPFPILIYNGNSTWDAPERFRDLLHQSAIPPEYLPEFKYFKIAINEISRRDLVKIRNAVAAIFYIENSSAADMAKNWNDLITLLRAALKKDGIEIIRAIMDRIYQIHNLPANSKTIQRIEDLTEVKSMLEANTKNWEKAVLEKGIGIGVEKNQIEMVERMAENGISNADIRKITGLPLNRIVLIRKKLKKSS
jgi:predicted transposase/invertase (TIGR01784 family)